MAESYPVWNDNTVDLLAKITNNTALIAESEAGDVAQIVAGTNITISPVGGTGVVTINAVGGVTSITGTANRITASASTGDVTIDISASYVGQATITILGTIATGVWNATAIADGKIASALTGKTYNGLTLTSTTGTFTLAAGKTLTQSNTLTYTGTDGSSVNFGTGGTVLYSGGSYVSSIAGTANQITASAATGAVTLSIPSTFIAPGSIQATTSVTGATGIFSTSALVGNGTAGNLLSALTVYDTGTSLPRGISNVQVNNGTDSANFSAYKARGTPGSLATIVTGDILGNFRSWGHDGTAYINSGSLRYTSSGTIATNRVPGQWELYTSTDASPSVLTLAWTVNSAQQFVNNVGSVAAPSYTFTGDTGLGVYRIASGNLGFAGGGSTSMGMNGTTVYGGTGGTTGQFLLRNDAGSASTPSYSFVGDTNTGFYWNSADIISLTTGGAEAFRFSVNNLDMLNAQIRFGGNGTVSGASGAVTVAASGTNQSIILTPSGTGRVEQRNGTTAQVLSVYKTYTDASNYERMDLVPGTTMFLTAANAGTGSFRALGFSGLSHIFQVGASAGAAATKVTISATNGNLLLGGLTTDGTGVLQLPNHATTAGGISLGAGVILSTTSSGSASARLSATSGGSVELSFNDFGANSIKIGSAAGVGYILNVANAAMTLGVNNTDVISFTSSTNVRVIGTKTLSFGATANATIGVSADTTAGVLTFTLPSTATEMKIAGATKNLFAYIDSSVSGFYNTTAAAGEGFATSTSAHSVIFQTNGNTTLTLGGSAAATLTGGNGNMTITSGTGNSRQMFLQTTTSGGVATTALTLGADQSASFAGNAVFNGTVNAGANTVSGGVATFTSIAVGGSAVTVTAANSVSPTSPNRTITITYGGTTYYLAAKTTND